MAGNGRRERKRHHSRHGAAAQAAKMRQTRMLELQLRHRRADTRQTSQRHSEQKGFPMLARQTIATRLGIAQRYVFSVYSSARFAGLIDFNLPRRPAPPARPARPISAPDDPTLQALPNVPAASKPEPAAEEVKPTQQRPSILSRILRKLLNAV